MGGVHEAKISCERRCDRRGACRRRGLGTGGRLVAGGEAAKPYAGTELEVIFLDRPGYAAAEKMIPEFEELTGITVNTTTVPYENALGEQVRDFVAQGDLDLALIDLVWIGNFAENGWIEPIETFTSNPELADPELDLDDFFPLVLNAFGGWNGTIYGLPFDNYSGLLFYNKCMLGGLRQAAGDLGGA